MRKQSVLISIIAAGIGFLCVGSVKAVPLGPVGDFTATAGYQEVDLAWTNPVAGFAGVKIQRATTGFPTNAADGTEVYNGTGTSTTDTVLSNGTLYYYTAFAYDVSTNYATGISNAAMPMASSVAGTISYVGAQTGFIGVAIFANPPTYDEEPVTEIVLGSVGAYIITNLVPGNYYVAAIIAVSGNPDSVRITDPWGVYVAVGNPQIVAVGAAQAVAGINFTLVDGSATNRNPFGKVVRNDFDGDGVSDIGCYDAEGNEGYPAGTWLIKQSTAGLTTNEFGYDGTVQITGDFDGDGVMDYGCYDPEGLYGQPPGSWYIMQSTAGFETKTFGYIDTIPIVGDFDGDGTDDYGCYDPEGLYGQPAGSWYFMQSTAGFTTDQLGHAGTVPLGMLAQGDTGPDYLDIIYPPFDDGTLWKPVNHSGGELIVLLSSSYFDEYQNGEFDRFVISDDPAGEDVVTQGEGTIVPDYHGRPAIRFSQQGSYYGPDPVYMVLMLTDGTRQPWYIPDPSERAE